MELKLSSGASKYLSSADVTSDHKFKACFEIGKLAQAMSMQNTKTPPEMVSEYFKVFDMYTETETKKQAVSCRKGCSFCCFVPLQITEAEGHILAKHLTEEIVETLKEQKQLDPKAPRPCVFLRDQECSVYQDRPLACRSHLVASPPENCDLESGREVMKLVIPGIEVVASAVYSAHGVVDFSDALLNQIAHPQEPQSEEKTTGGEDAGVS